MDIRIEDNGSKDLIEDNLYFADKSLFIKEIIDEDSRVTLLPRPRRFGKTLNLTMLQSFFEKTDVISMSYSLFQK